MNNSLQLVSLLIITMLILVPLNGLFIKSLNMILQTLKVKRALLINLIVGFSVAIPELFIAIQALLLNKAELALGVSVGSGLVLIALISGIFAVFTKELKTNAIFTKNTVIFMTLLSIMFILLAFDGVLSRLDGILLLLAYLIYLSILGQNKANFTINKTKIKHKKLLSTSLICVISLILMFFATKLVGEIAASIYTTTNFSLFSIGLIIIAPFSAIPELVYILKLNTEERKNISFGEILTSLIINTTLLIGIVALVSPIQVKTNLLFYFSSLFFAIVLMIFNISLSSKNSINWKEGIQLIITYIVFLLACFSIILG